MIALKSTKPSDMKNGNIRKHHCRSSIEYETLELLRQIVFTTNLVGSCFCIDCKRTIETTTISFTKWSQVLRDACQRIWEPLWKHSVGRFWRTLYARKCMMLMLTYEVETILTANILPEKNSFIPFWMITCATS